MLLKVLNDSLVLENVEYCVLAQWFVHARGRTGFLGGMVLGGPGRSVAPTGALCHSLLPWSGAVGQNAVGTTLQKQTARREVVEKSLNKQDALFLRT